MRQVSSGTSFKGRGKAKVAPELYLVGEEQGALRSISLWDDEDVSNFLNDKISVRLSFNIINVVNIQNKNAINGEMVIIARKPT